MAFGFGAAPGVPQGLSADDIKRLLAQQAGVSGAPQMPPPDQGQPPAPSIPFGFGASLFGAPSVPGALPPQAGAAPMPPTRPPGMGYDPLVAENEAATRAAEAQTGMVPQAPPARAPRPLSFGASAQPVPAPTASPQFLADDAPMPNVRVPLPPVRPNFGLVPGATAQADMPAADAIPASGTMPAPTAQPAASSAPGFSFGSLFQKLGESGVGDTLIGLGTGLMSTKGFGPGLNAGFQNAQKYNVQRAVSDLARAELALKTGKVQRETAANNSTRASLIQAGHAPEKVDLAISASGAGHSEALNNLLKTAVPAPVEPKFGWEKRSDGTLAPVVGGPEDPNYLRRQNQASAEGTAAGKPDDTYAQVPEAERVSLGLPTGSYQRDSKGKLSAVNPSGQTINMGGEKAQDATVGKGYGEYQLDLATKGRNAGSTINTLSLMEQAARDPNFYSGVGAEGLKKANQLMVSLGVKDASFTKPTEVFEALSNKVVLDSLGGSLGPGISNTDRDYLGRVAPGLSRTKEGNLELIGVARSLAQRQQEVARLAREYAGQRNGRIDAGFDDVLADYSAKNPLFPAAAAASTAQPVGQTGSGRMAAPDRSAIDAELRRRGLR
ncbi:hypothetical protein FPV16_17920 [Methylobacterium sp. W2]|uniref:hypothetical protein n=1 Tax=Methylobacterium sp. W2 TaxID=2598107 RepID=UPI001D0C1F88|nr:hypothetical protein [Methylobacterium sp. W2]MCC0808065.1 hypothetical protein [Methylobacterium sp. W2]